MQNDESILEDIKEPVIRASYGQNYIANLVDTVIELAILFALYFLLPRYLIDSLSGTSVILYVFIPFVVTILYRCLIILLTGKTIGMKIARTRFLNRDLQPLDTREKLIISSLFWKAGIKTFED